MIKDLTEKINLAAVAAQEPTFGEKLQEEVNVLLSCPDYDGETFDCKNCHFFAILRKTTASLAVREGRLESRRHHVKVGMSDFTG